MAANLDPFRSGVQSGQPAYREIRPDSDHRRHRDREQHACHLPPAIALVFGVIGDHPAMLSLPSFRRCALEQSTPICRRAELCLNPELMAHGLVLVGARRVSNRVDDRLFSTNDFRLRS